MYNPASCHLKPLAGQIGNGKRTEKTLTIGTQHVRCIAGPTLGRDVSFKIIPPPKSASFNDAFDGIPPPALLAPLVENGGRARRNRAHVSTITVSTEEQRTQ